MTKTVPGNPYLTEVSRNFMKRDFTAAQSLSLNKIKETVEKNWDNGQNIVIGWCPGQNFVDIVVNSIEKSVLYFEEYPRIFKGSRILTASQIEQICKIMDITPTRIYIPGIIGNDKYNISVETINNFIKRYCISYTENRAVILFDIVRFSLQSPLAQLVQLKKLEGYISKVETIMEKNGIPVDLCRSTTGDGFYIWNHNIGTEHDMRTFIAFSLIIIMNNLSEVKIPLRSAFAIGSHFTFHNIDKNIPRGVEYIVGDVTIKLSRIISECNENQILIDSFVIQYRGKNLGVVRFLQFCQELFSNVEKFMYDNDEVLIFGVNVPLNSENRALSYDIIDKHGFSHSVCNLKLNALIGSQSHVTLGIDYL